MKRPRTVGDEPARVPLEAPGIGLLLALVDLRAGATGRTAGAPVDRRRGPHRAPRD